jgi:hypothetical protein
MLCPDNIVDSELESGQVDKRLVDPHPSYYSMCVTH